MHSIKNCDILLAALF